jgi:hypothetical protein
MRLGLKLTAVNNIVAGSRPDEVNKCSQFN